MSTYIIAFPGEVQYKFVAAEQKSQLVGREYTNIKYSAEQVGPGVDPIRMPISMSSQGGALQAHHIKDNSTLGSAYKEMVHNIFGKVPHLLLISVFVPQH